MAKKLFYADSVNKFDIICKLDWKTAKLVRHDVYEYMCGLDRFVTSVKKLDWFKYSTVISMSVNMRKNLMELLLSPLIKEHKVYTPGVTTYSKHYHDDDLAFFFTSIMSKAVAFTRYYDPKWEEGVSGLTIYNFIITSLLTFDLKVSILRNFDRYIKAFSAYSTESYYCIFLTQIFLNSLPNETANLLDRTLLNPVVKMTVVENLEYKGLW